MLERWVTTEEVAAHIGKPTSFIYANAKRLGMRYSKVGQQYRWRLSEVDAWMDSQKGGDR
jgi:excisionase family DNA binding protein